MDLRAGLGQADDFVDQRTQALDDVRATDRDGQDQAPGATRVQRLDRGARTTQLCRRVVDAIPEADQVKRLGNCDEPTGALDFATGVRVLAVIDRINRELGTTTALITHNALAVLKALGFRDLTDGVQAVTR